MFDLFIPDRSGYDPQPMRVFNCIGLFLLLWASRPGSVLADVSSTDAGSASGVVLEPAAEPAPIAVAVPVAGTNAPAPELWFPIGEELVYDIYWGMIHVGQTRATTEWMEEDGRRLLLVRLRTRTNRVLSVLYPVDDYIESQIDPDGFIPVRFILKLSEGRHRKDEETLFDHANGEAHWKDHLSGKTAIFPIEKDTRDIPALMYYLRQRQLEPGASYDFQVMADEKVYSMSLDALEVEDVPLLKYGPVPSLRLEPKAKFSGVFVNKGRLWIWVSRDERRVATKISAEVPVARVHLYLREVLGPGSEKGFSAVRVAPVTPRKKRR
jgi:hypothetical protein